MQLGGSMTEHINGTSVHWFNTNWVLIQWGSATLQEKKKALGHLRQCPIQQYLESLVWC